MTTFTLYITLSHWGMYSVTFYGRVPQWAMERKASGLNRHTHTSKVQE